MKKVLMATFAFLIVLTSYSQESQKIQMSFYKVEESKRVEYETLMKDYFGKIMSERVKLGCMENWIFRRVMPNSSMAEQFTHITIDVLNPGAESYPCDNLNVEEVFPNISQEMRLMLRDLKNSYRNLIYRTKLKKVAGFNRTGVPMDITIYNFTKTKSPNYKLKHQETSNIFSDYMNRDAWHAFERDEHISWASKEWDYMTIDGYSSMDKLNTPGKNVPTKLMNSISKKYGSASSQRDIMKRVMAKLIFSAKK